MPQAKLRTADIIDSQITLAKMANITSNSLIGRAAAGTGVPEVITLGTNLSLSGTTLNATGGGAGTTPYAETPSGLLNGSNTAFTLVNTPSNGQGVLVFLDGIFQYYNTDFTVTGNTINFVTAPSSTTATIFAVYGVVSGDGGGITASSTNTLTNKSIALSGNTLTGTKTEFNTALTDGDFLYAGDVIAYTDEMAQDAVGAMVDTTFVYTDLTPLLSRAALTGAITASSGSNTTSLGSFTLSALNTAISDADVATGGGTATGSNTGDQTTIVGITGTKAEFDTAVTDGNFLYVGDITQGVTQMAAIGAVPNANGASISTNTLTLQPANGSFGGVVTTANQTFAGNKTLSGLTFLTGGFSTSSSTTDANLSILSSSSTQAYVASQVMLGGASTIHARIIERGLTLPNLGVGDAYASHIIGTQGLTEATSGTHPLVAQLAIKPLTINDQAGTTTNSASLYIEGAATGATNNYSIWVDAGTVRLDAGLELQGIASATAANVLFYDATTKAVTYGTAPTGGAGVTDGDKGDVIVSASGATWLIDKAIAYTWTAAHAFNAGLTAASTGTTFGLGTRTIDSQTVNGSNDAKFKLDSSGGLATSTWQVNEAVDGSFITMTASDLTISTGALKLPAVAFATKLDVLYYDAATKVVSYGTAPGGAPSIGRNYATPTSNFTIFSTGDATDYIYFATNTITGTLSSAASNADKIIVKNKGTGVVTLVTVLAQTIDGSSSITIQPGNSVTLLSDGANWFII